ncbi:MAG: transporter [Planctomycetota bacterium]|nr:MAG: transporter [Planctomycetota bacterium]
MMDQRPPSSQRRASAAAPRPNEARVRRRAGQGSKTILILLAALVPMVASAGCGLRQWVRNGFKVGPNYVRPPAPVAPAYIDSDNSEITTDPAHDCAWWTVLNDPTLNGLIETAYRQNLDLRVAGTRILEARAQRNIAAGNLFPQTQSALAAYGHGQITENLAAPFASSFNIWATGFNASWELDFWGRYRRTIEAADADSAASIEGYGDALVMLFSEVATAYVQLRTYEERLRFARHNVEIQQGSLDLAEHRFREGVATELDVTQARTSLAQTESAIPPLEAGRRQANNQLCILLGMPVVDMAGTFPPAAIPAAPPTLAVGLPADLLRRRPDVRRAEREVAAQSANLGVAKADLYPRLTVGGFLGYAADDIERLFASKSFTAFVIPTLQWPILNYGRLANNIMRQDARLQGAALQYQQTVLNAGREVEDSLVAFLKSQQQAAKLEVSVQNAERSVELVLTQFKGGVSDFNRVYNTQEALVSQQDQLAVARGEIALNLIRTYKALGGGWTHFCRGRGFPAVYAVDDVSGEEVPTPEPVEGSQPLPPAVPTAESPVEARPSSRRNPQVAATTAPVPAR